MKQEMDLGLLYCWGCSGLLGKKDLSPQVKVLTYQTYSGHEILIMSDRKRSWIQVAEISFLHKVVELSFREGGRSWVSK